MSLRWRLCAYAVAGFSLLAACDGTDSSVGGTMQTDYLAARNALQSERYTVAIKHYQKLLRRLGGRPAARVQLEYSHALLRANHFEEAISTVTPLVQSREPSIRASAFAVRGTARHEQALALMAAGQLGPDTRTFLTGARDDLSVFLRKYKKWDTAGSMRARLKLVRKDLKTL